MAAGLGFKTFTSGEVLTAADTNGYLMQGILVFASASARNAAITSPQEGQFCFLKDTNSTEYYDGAAWVSGVEGDISGVTAGTGISGGGTSGTVTVTNSMATAITTKGDLVPGTGSGTFSRLAAGANGTILLADSTAATGLAWASPKIVQVVTGSYSTVTSSSSTTYADTGLTATITPKFSTSTILVIVNQNGLWKSSGNSGNAINLRLLRGATNLVTFAGEYAFTGTALEFLLGSASVAYLDSPATTSATTYKTQFANRVAAAAVQVQTNSGQSTITLMEIGA